MKHALKILGLGFLLVPAAFSQSSPVTTPCACEIQCSNGATYSYPSTTFGYCCKQFADLCGDEGTGTCLYQGATQPRSCSVL